MDDFELDFSYKPTSSDDINISHNKRITIGKNSEDSVMITIKIKYTDINGAWIKLDHIVLMDHELAPMIKAMSQYLKLKNF